MLVEPRAYANEPPNAFDGTSFDATPVAVAGGGLTIEVGLVNNMPDAALKDTERQFRQLLDVGSGERLSVRLHLLSMAGVPRSAEARGFMRGRYVDFAYAPRLSLDALIVTGAEPKAKSLREESYWHEFTRVMDWAERHTISTICSCLAAHAAALHFDGIARRPLGAKLSGVFECAARRDHAFSWDLPPRIATPHSRFNEVGEEDLRRAGYRILSRSPIAGADMFAKTRGDCTFLLFQGHPEYQATTLRREYRRDLLRFLYGEREAYPSAPVNYFEPELAWRLAQFEKRAKARRSPELVSELPLPTEEKAADGAPRWAAPAAVIYRNWLRHIADAKWRASVAPPLIETRVTG